MAIKFVDVEPEDGQAEAVGEGRRAAGEARAGRRGA